MERRWWRRILAVLGCDKIATGLPYSAVFRRIGFARRATLGHEAPPIPFARVVSYGLWGLFDIARFGVLPWAAHLCCPALQG
jgi:hypothetical protein